MGQEVEAILNSVQTFKKQEVWPASKSILEKFEAKPWLRCCLQFSSTKANAALGLPVEVTAWVLLYLFSVNRARVNQQACATWIHVVYCWSNRSASLLPFRSADWQYITAENPNGSILVSDNAQEIISHINGTKLFRIIIIDDFQYVMANEFMRRSAERGFISSPKLVWMPEHYHGSKQRPSAKARLYFKPGLKKISTVKQRSNYRQNADKRSRLRALWLFSTNRREPTKYLQNQNNGNTSLPEAPMEMFSADHIDNDLSIVDDAICEYYGLPMRKPQAESSNNHKNTQSAA